jgi:hypothetical protein
MKAFARFGSVALVLLIVSACGGGSSSDTCSLAPCSTTFAGNASTAATTDATSDTSAAYVISIDVARTGVSVSQISASETTRASAVVRDKTGNAVPGVVVKFAEVGGPLLRFAPAIGTALTDTSGVAAVDLTGIAADVTGATSVSASTTILTTAVSANKAIQVVAGASNPTAVTFPASLNFLGSTPAVVAIVIRGAGGTGRSETAILRFKAVDLSGAPVKDAQVSFALNADSGGAAIAPLQVTTNADGIATTTVSSGTRPASIVVRASATGSAGTTVTSQSDTLIVSNGVPFAGGFEIVAAKYNLDGKFTGDNTTITAFVRDQFGNPVPDGVAVSFDTNYGVVASSTVGGCVTANGRCSVRFSVQNPRGDGLAAVVGQLRLGTQTTLTNSININMDASGDFDSYFAFRDPGGPPLDETPSNSIRLVNCKETVELFVGDSVARRRSPAAGTSISSGVTPSGAAVTVSSGSPASDSLSFQPVSFSLAFDLSSADLSPRCANSGGSRATKSMTLVFRTPNDYTFAQRFSFTYPVLP